MSADEGAGSGAHGAAGLGTAQTETTEGGLTSTAFGDIYYSLEDGLAETRHVFLDGNDLRSRFASLSAGEPFTIGELGFGTGLNVLAAWDLFDELAPNGATLHIWSVEGFPLSPSDFRAALARIGARWPELADKARSLSDAYPTPRPGLAQLRLGRLTLTLAFGEVEEMFARSVFKADAWFLDGFAPALNPEMWSAPVFSALAAHSHPGATAATFTVAGHVRRTLAADGFAPEKTPGFGRKREMLRARREGAKPPFQRPVIDVIGAGIAGACTAYHARAAGAEVRLFERETLGAGASGNPLGLLMPRFEAADNAAARFYRDAYLYAHRFYDEAAPEAVNRIGGTLPLEEARAAKIRATKLWAPDDWHLVGGVAHVAGAATLRPTVAISNLCAKPEPNERSGRPPQANGRTRVLCLGAGLLAEAGPVLSGDLIARRGQVDWFAGSGPPSIVTEGTYIAPLDEGIIAGATYTDLPEGGAASITPEDTAHNKDAAIRLGSTPGRHEGARASVRATTTDRHPVVGILSTSSEGQEPYVIGGLGSRGLVTAPLLAAHIVQHICGGVSPLEREGAAFLSPQRFEERRRRRRE